MTTDTIAIRRWVVGWGLYGLSLFAVAGYWARQLSDTSAFAWGKGWFEGLALGPPLILFVGLLLLPVILVGAKLTLQRSGQEDRARKAIRSTSLLGLLMLGFATGQVMSLGRLSPLAPGEEFGLLAFAAVPILWLFLGETTPDVKLVVLLSAWAAALAALRFSLASLLQAIDLTEASLTTQILAGIEMVLLLGLVALPFVVLGPGGLRRTSAIGSFLSRVSAELPLSAFAIGAVASIANQWPGRDQVKVGIAVTPVVALVIVAACCLALRALSQPDGAGIPNETIPSRRLYRALVLLVLFAYALIVATIVAHQLQDIGGLDGLAYLQVARSYGEGHSIVRGYWSPLMSWLAAPVSALGAEPILGIRIVQSLAGAIWIYLTLRLSSLFGLTRVSRIGLALAVATLAVTHAIDPLTADMLGATVVCGYFVAVLSPEVLRNPTRQGLVAGLLGALAYFAKYYNFPFVLGHLFLATALRLAHGAPPRTLWRFLRSSLIAFGMVSLPWIIALSLRYGRPTITTTGTINHALVAPGASSGPACGQRSGLCPKPTDVLFPWEDPLPEYAPLRDWAPWDNLRSFQHQILVVSKNVRYWVSEILFAHGPLFPIALLGTLLATLVSWQVQRQRFLGAWILLTVGLYISGYMLSWSFELRYYFTLIPLFLIALFRLLQGLHPALPHGPRGSYPHFLGSILLAILLVGPTISIFQFHKVTTLMTIPYQPCLADASLAMRPHLIPPTAGSDSSIQYVAYYTRIRTYGVMGIDHTGAGANQELRRNRIRSYLLPSDAPLRTELEQEYGYRAIFSLLVCDTRYTILHVPNP